MFSKQQPLEKERKLDDETFYSHLKEAIVTNNFNFVIELISKNPHIDINHTFPSVFDKRILVRTASDPRLKFNERFFDSKQDILILYKEKFFYVSYKSKSIKEITKKTINSEAYEQLKLRFPIQNNLCKLADSEENILINQVGFIRELKTLLQLAIEQNNIPLFDCLIKHPKIHIDRPLLENALPVPPLIYAVMLKKPYFLESLIKAGAKRDVSLFGIEAYTWIAQLSSDVLSADKKKSILKLFPYRELSDQSWLLTKMQSLKETCGFLRLPSENDQNLDSEFINKCINELAMPIDDSRLIIEFSNKFYHFVRDSQQINEIQTSPATKKLKTIFSAMQAKATPYKTANTAEIALINAADSSTLQVAADSHYGHAEGVCQGYSMMGINTSLTLDEKGQLIELERFKKISKRINEIPREDFRRIITEIKNKQIQLLQEAKDELRKEHQGSEYDSHALQQRLHAKLKSLPPSELIDLDLIPFLDGIELFQSPEEHLQLHNERLLLDRQKDLLFPLFASPSVEKEGGIICAASLQGVFIKKPDHDELKTYLETLRQQCLRSNLDYPISMLLATNTHVITINYNPVKDEWTLILPNMYKILKQNNVIVIRTSDELVNSIRNTFHFGYLMYYNLDDLSIINKDISKYAGCLIWVGKQQNEKLYYIDSQGLPQEIQILDKEKFKNLTRIKSQSSPKNLDSKDPESKQDLEKFISLSMKEINELLENSQNILKECMIFCSNIYVTKKNVQSMKQLINECMEIKIFRELFLITPEKVLVKDYDGYLWSNCAMMNNDLNQLQLINKVTGTFIENFNANKKYKERANDHFGELHKKELVVKDKLKFIKSSQNLFEVESVRGQLQSYCASLNKNLNSKMGLFFGTKANKYALDFFTEVLSIGDQESYVTTEDNQKLKLALFKVYTLREANGEVENLSKINSMFKTFLSDAEFTKIKHKETAEYKEDYNLSSSELDSSVMSTEPPKRGRRMQEENGSAKRREKFLFHRPQKSPSLERKQEDSTPLPHQLKRSHSLGH